LPFETIIKARQQEYYDVLAECDKEGKSTKFIEFILEAIDESLGELLMLQNRSLTEEGRIDYFLATYQDQFFTRKDYLNTFKDISSSTASRDIKYAVEKGLITKQGDKRTAKYRIEGKGD
jgi:Fic family protein